MMRPAAILRIGPGVIVDGSTIHASDRTLKQARVRAKAVANALAPKHFAIKVYRVKKVIHAIRT